jgi:hypothetical protein
VVQVIFAGGPEPLSFLLQLGLNLESLDSLEFLQFLRNRNIEPAFLPIASTTDMAAGFLFTQ